jgi:hypothetical protein
VADVPIVALKSRKADPHQKRHGGVAIAKSNGNTSKKVLGTRKNRIEIHLGVVGIFLRSCKTKFRIEVKSGSFFLARGALRIPNA